ncbi:MAG: hypothetical protein B7X48_14335 [Acidiphilium sp. 34-60-192]|nr:MAG: hypothetical protein B7X48_14335 [Acidiphilium sp. 34-60-192]
MICKRYPVTRDDTAALRDQMRAAGIEKPRARCFPTGLGRINIKSLADREAVIRILLDRGACHSWGVPLTESDLESWIGNGGLEYFFQWSRRQPARAR